MVLSLMIGDLTMNILLKIILSSLLHLLLAVVVTGGYVLSHQFQSTTILPLEIPPKPIPTKVIPKPSKVVKLIHSIESTNGTNLYRPGDTSCASTTKPCGHHQLSVQALKQVGYGHENYWLLRTSLQWSQQRAQEYIDWLSKHYSLSTITQLYLAYNQGGGGIRTVINVSKGIGRLGATRSNILGNIPSSKMKVWSTYSDRRLANAFLQHWEAHIQRKLRSIYE